MKSLRSISVHTYSTECVDQLDGSQSMSHLPSLLWPFCLALAIKHYFESQSFMVLLIAECDFGQNSSCPDEPKLKMRLVQIRNEWKYSELSPYQAHNIPPKRRCSLFWGKNISLPLMSPNIITKELGHGKKYWINMLRECQLLEAGRILRAWGIRFWMGDHVLHLDMDELRPPPKHTHTLLATY